jgi:hypothetical protein
VKLYVGTVQIYVAAMEALRKKERQRETQFAQSSRVTIVVVRVGAVKLYVATVKIYVAAMEALRKNERQRETQFTTFSEFPPPPPPLKANVLFGKFFLNLTPCMIKLRVLMLCFPYFTDNSNIPNVN